MENEIGLSRGIVLSPVGPLLWTKLFSGDIKIKWNVSVRPAVPDLGGLLKRHYISDQHLHSTTFSPILLLVLVSVSTFSWPRSVPEARRREQKLSSEEVGENLPEELKL